MFSLIVYQNKAGYESYFHLKNSSFNVPSSNQFVARNRDNVKMEFIRILTIAQLFLIHSRSLENRNTTPGTIRFDFHGEIGVEFEQALSR